jgi:hypothetical protein
VVVNYGRLGKTCLVPFSRVKQSDEASTAGPLKMGRQVVPKLGN